MKKYNIDLFIGNAEFHPSSTASSPTNSVIRVCRPSSCVEIESKHVCIATGSRSHRPAELRPGVPLPFTKGRVICSTEMGSLAELPTAVAIIGGGVIATEYATVLAEVRHPSLARPQLMFLLSSE